jgi:hypothetical protein
VVPHEGHLALHDFVDHEERIGAVPDEIPQTVDVLDALTLDVLENPGQSLLIGVQV